MSEHNPAISVSGYRSDTKRDVACVFEYAGLKIDINISNAVATSDANREHEEARKLLLAAAGALAEALRDR